MQTIEYWQVDSSYDRDVSIVGRFSNENAALLVAGHAGKLNNYVRNKNYRSVTKHVITIFDSVDEFEDNSVAKVRERALAKLTPQEKQVLGLK